MVAVQFSQCKGTFCINKSSIQSVDLKVAGEKKTEMKIKQDRFKCLVLLLWCLVTANALDGWLCHFVGIAN